jgi:peptidoglycan/LPS O-acetylase OafA/YrhL
MVSRLRQLDILRGIAVLLVLGRHLPLPPPDAPRALAIPAELWHRGGWIGVDLFFVLSGFLVSGLLFQEMARTGTVLGGRFLIRRGFKIYPPFLLLWAVTAIYAWYMTAGDRPGPFPLRHALHELFFIQNYFEGFWNHTWSLAIEEHFYFLLTLLFVALARQRRGGASFSAVPLVFGLVAATCLLLRWEVTSTSPFYYYTHLFPTHLRIDSLFFGVLLAYGWHVRNWREASLAPAHRWGLLVAGTSLLVPPFLYPLELTPWLQWLGPTLLYLGSGLVLMGVMQTPITDRTALRGIAAMGVFSYSIYLWHMPVNRWLMPLIDAVIVPVPWAPRALLALIAAVALGIGLGKFVEYPMLRLRDRWFPSRTT